ncbi:MAG: YjbQ family protein [Thermococci archaeon]|nr:YjbQ family protein [Thermococci archaeon]
MIVNLEIQTRKPVEIVDITNMIQEAIWKSDVTHGIVLVFTRHTTTGLIINENEPNLVEDILGHMEELVPRGKGYKHDTIDRNAHSHLRASLLLNPSVALPVDAGELQLGPWQRVMLVELDGPRHRKVTLMICPCAREIP